MAATTHRASLGWWATSGAPAFSAPPTIDDADAELVTRRPAAGQVQRLHRVSAEVSGEVSAGLGSNRFSTVQAGLTPPKRTGSVRFKMACITVSRKNLPSRRARSEGRQSLTGIRASHYTQLSGPAGPAGPAREPSLATRARETSGGEGVMRPQLLTTLIIHGTRPAAPRCIHDA